MARILVVGVATFDVINTVESYPLEDTEIRALSQRQARGGNSANSAVCLSQLGHDVTWLGNLADDLTSEAIVDDLVAHSINVDFSPRLNNTTTPTSYITHSQQTASRSIVHFRNLPELSADAFLALDLSLYDWIHFEGRNCEQLALMLQAAHQQEKLISLEIEKPRDNIERLMPLSEVLLFSRHYVESQGFTKAEDFLMQTPFDNQAVFCAWGEKGAWARIGGTCMHANAYKPLQLLDTVGAGDAFNASIIDSFIRGLSIEKSLSSACKFAGLKCGQIGFSNLNKGCEQ